MDVVRLPFGELARPEDDCIRLHHLPDGRVRLEGTVLSGEASASIGGSYYTSEEAAEAAGLAWANECDVARIYVARLGPEEVENE